MLIPGRPASLKNDKQIFQQNVLDPVTHAPIIDPRTGKALKQSRIGKTPDVRNYIRLAQDKISRAREAANFELVPIPKLVGALAVLFLYAPDSARGLPTADDDNLWGTIQESLQDGVVCEDDGQVRDHRPVFMPAKALTMEMTLLYLWSYEGNPFALHNTPAFTEWFYSPRNPYNKLVLP